MAKTPPSRSYKLFSGVVSLACAFTLSAPANTAIGAAVSASPATTLRLVIDVETTCAMVTSLGRMAAHQHTSWMHQADGGSRFSGRSVEPSSRSWPRRDDRPTETG